MGDMMQYVSIKNLEKYHPGYKDRSLIWCKVHFSMINGDPEFELLCEIDQLRFIKFIMLELQNKKPTPLDPVYLTRKGFDLKKRPISLTLDMLHNFISYVTEDQDQALPRVEKSRVEKSRVEKSRVEKSGTPPSIEEIKAYCLERKNKVDPNRFHSYYESNGWKIGKNQMKSWKAAIRTWEGRELKPGFNARTEHVINDDRDIWEKKANKHCVNCRGTGSVYAPGSGKFAKCGCVV